MDKKKGSEGGKGNGEKEDMPKGAVGDRGDKHDGDGERIAIEIIDDNSNDIEVEKDGEVRENAGHLAVGAPPGIEGGDSVDENVANNGTNMDEEKGAQTGKEDNESIDTEDVMDNGKKDKGNGKESAKCHWRRIEYQVRGASHYHNYQSICDWVTLSSTVN